MLSSRICTPETFTFGERGNRCTYWSTGEHIVHQGACRCGKRFRMVEEFADESSVAVLSIAHSLAYEAATGYIDSECLVADGWMDTRSISPEFAVTLQDCFRYLDLRGLIERKEGDPHLIRFRDESEATA